MNVSKVLRRKAREKDGGREKGRKEGKEIKEGKMRIQNILEGMCVSL